MSIIPIRKPTFLTRPPKTAMILLSEMRPEHYSAVLAIDAACGDFPMTNRELLTLMRRGSTTGMIAKQGETIVGFFILEDMGNRLEIYKLVVGPGYARRGIGSRMIAGIKLEAQRVCVRALAIIVRESNLAGQLFLKHQGFACKKVLHEHWIDTFESGYLFACRLADCGGK